MPKAGYRLSVHLKSKKGAACGVPGKRWSSAVVTSNPNPNRVTCKRCLSLLAGESPNVHK
jgi:hypothetical protein